ncbi:hypothetical protein [Nocardiopsis nanhaiensis]
MAKKSKIARNEQRKKVVARYAERRAELKRLVKSPHTGEEERAAAFAELRRQPRDADAPGSATATRSTAARAPT